MEKSTKIWIGVGLTTTFGLVAYLIYKSKSQQVVTKATPKPIAKVAQPIPPEKIVFEGDLPNLPSQYGYSIAGNNTPSQIKTSVLPYNYGMQMNYQNYV